jgi:hypothetical protein
MKSENIIPTGEKYDKLYDSLVSVYMENFVTSSDKTALQNAKTEEEYNAVINQIKEKAIDYYGDDFFKTSVYYEVLIDELIEWNNFPA